MFHWKIAQNRGFSRSPQFSGPRPVSALGSLEYFHLRPVYGPYTPVNNTDLRGSVFFPSRSSRNEKNPSAASGGWGRPELVELLAVVAATSPVGRRKISDELLAVVAATNPAGRRKNCDEQRRQRRVRRGGPRSATPPAAQHQRRAPATSPGSSSPSVFLLLPLVFSSCILVCNRNWLASVLILNELLVG